MATRTSRNFSEMDKKELLKDLENCRYACVRTCAKAPIYSDIYKMADKLISNIDAAAEVLTGNRQHFYGKGHSTHQRL